MLAIRWTIGDVNPRGFASLRASVCGAWRLFGPRARYRIYVNSLDLEDASARCGELPSAVEWRPVKRELPAWLADLLVPSMAEGVAWKFVPLRAFPDDHELSLDNTVVLWDVPRAIRDWLEGRAQFVLAEDVRPSFGRFAARCGERPLTTGIRGLAPDFVLEDALRAVLAHHPGGLHGELDHQGAQVAAVLTSGATAIVELHEVTSCAPFPPHVPHLGSAGAQFVGLNTRRLGFEVEGRAAEEVRAEHWDGHAAEIARRVGLSL